MIISLRFTEFFNKAEFSNCLIFLLLYAKTWWTIKKLGNFYDLPFFSLVQICVFKVKKFFMYFFGDILRLGSQYFADPDPKHWLMLVNKCKYMTWQAHEKIFPKTRFLDLNNLSEKLPKNMFIYLGFLINSLILLLSTNDTQHY